MRVRKAADCWRVSARSNLIVIETDDAVLVADRSHVQDIKGLVSRIKREKSPEADAHRKVRRPWGFYDSIDHGDRFQVKRIVVMPGRDCRCRCITTARNIGLS